MNHNRIVLILITMTFVFVFALSSNSVSADTTVTKNAKIIVPPVCSIGATGMNTHNATAEIGTYVQNIGTTTATVTCNDSEGFSIYASGYTGDKVGQTNSNKLVGTELSNNTTISTGTATSGETSNWAMKLAPDTASNPQYPITILSTYASYASVPSDYTKVATRTAATDIGTGAEGSTFTTTYAAYISNTQAADTYTGKVKYILVHPNTNTPPQPQTTPAGYIGYYPNASGVTGQMGRESATNSQEVVLYAPNFKRDGYGFAGWNTEPDYTGIIYGPNQTITAPEDVETTGLSLYAIWIQSEGSMQHFATSTCNKLTKAPTDGTATLDSVSALTDLRDGNTYAIAKLADNKCWMIENLRLDDSAELTAGNTNSPLLPLTNTDGTTSNHLSPTTDPAQTAWCTTKSAACSEQSMLATNNTTLFINNTSSNYNINSTVYSYGNYYNWYSATAGNGLYSMGSGDAAGDICPNGWRLPTGGSASGEFGELDQALGGTGSTSLPNTNPTGATMSLAYRAYPNNFIYAGQINGSPIGYGGSYGGDYWSSTTRSSDNYASYLRFVKSGAGPQTFTTKYIGFTVRCIQGSL